MIILAAILIALIAVGLGLFIAALWRAPVGWEDEQGFHYGEPRDRDRVA